MGTPTCCGGFPPTKYPSRVPGSIRGRCKKRHDLGRMRSGHISISYGTPCEYHSVVCVKTVHHFPRYPRTPREMGFEWAPGGISWNPWWGHPTASHGIPWAPHGGFPRESRCGNSHWTHIGSSAFPRHVMGSRAIPWDPTWDACYGRGIVPFGGKGF